MAIADVGLAKLFLNGRIEVESFWDGERNNPKVVAPGVFKEYHKVLLKNQLPSFGKVKYPAPYSALDFASFFKYMMYNIFKKDHQAMDVNIWVVVCWILIFNPQYSSEDNPILAYYEYDMIGGQFNFCDFQVYLESNQVMWVTLCVSRSNNHTHQTLDGASPSDEYTWIGFSCQMFERMFNAVVTYIKQ
ncbi:uncharacterized protein VP01_3205g2 [Puccinia sorghi]|uniref:Tet-like 2OG-Fe(II) oxygenase domain-containing protein n=1 Tax=Puccinia sorghi TaxID=27349 RepID=A0A0L6UYI1_9BASI|nr:uncharacterized protein VP01_3205g2 [Puccinia sorghi]